MSQGSLVLPTTGTLPGLTLVQDINTALDAFATTNAGASAPTNSVAGAPEIGQLWYDTVNNVLKMYTGSAWLIVPPGFQNVTALTSGTSWTVPAGVTQIHLQMLGGGGGGGGAYGGSGKYCYAAGGEGGEYLSAIYGGLTPGASIAYSIGAGGAGGSNTPGGGFGGGNTTFGSLTVQGGLGGQFCSPGAFDMNFSNYYNCYGPGLNLTQYSGGFSSSGSFILLSNTKRQGGSGSLFWLTSGGGGGSPFGTGGATVAAPGAGNAGSGYGSGGSGGAENAAAGQPGGAGTQGIIVIRY